MEKNRIENPLEYADTWYPIIGMALLDARTPMELILILENFSDINRASKIAAQSNLMKSKLSEIMYEKFHIKSINFSETEINLDTKYFNPYDGYGWIDSMMVVPYKGGGLRLHSFSKNLKDSLSSTDIFNDSYYVYTKTEDYFILGDFREKILVCYKNLFNQKLYNINHGYWTLITQDDDDLIFICKSNGSYKIYLLKSEAELLMEIPLKFIKGFGSKGYYYQGNIISYKNKKIIGKYEDKENLIMILPLWRHIDKFIYSLGDKEYFMSYDYQKGEILNKISYRTFEWMCFTDTEIIDMVSGYIIYTVPKGYIIYALMRNSETEGYTVAYRLSEEFDF